jgi:hypothetical protein
MLWWRCNSKNEIVGTTKRREKEDEISRSSTIASRSLFDHDEKIIIDLAFQY